MLVHQSCQCTVQCCYLLSTQHGLTTSTSLTKDLGSACVQHHRAWLNRCHDQCQCCSKPTQYGRATLESIIWLLMSTCVQNCRAWLNRYCMSTASAAPRQAQSSASPGDSTYRPDLNLSPVPIFCVVSHAQSICNTMLEGERESS